MTAYWYEANDGSDVAVQKSDGTVRRRYVVIGVATDMEAYGVALAQLPSVGEMGYILSDVSVKSLVIQPSSDQCSFEVVATWSHPQSEDAKEKETEQFVGWTWRASSATETLTHALHQTEYPGGFVDDNGVLKRAIEATDSGEVKGVPVPVPQLELIVWRYFARRLMKGSQGVTFMRNMATSVGCSNAQPWWGFERGELILTAAEPEERGVQDVKISLTMSCQANRKNIDFGNVGNANVVVPEKRGAQYLWVYHKRSEADNGLEMVPKPWRVCVADVVPEIDFATLGFPNAPP